MTNMMTSCCFLWGDLTLCLSSEKRRSRSLLKEREISTNFAVTERTLCLGTIEILHGQLSAQLLVNGGVWGAKPKFSKVKVKLPAVFQKVVRITINIQESKDKS